MTFSPNSQSRWTPSEKTTFFTRLSEYWPGSVMGKAGSAGEETGLIRLWLEEIGSYPLAIALQALREIKAEEEYNRCPSAKIVKRKCGQLMMVSHGVFAATPRDAHIKILTAQPLTKEEIEQERERGKNPQSGYNGGRWISPKGTTWEITTSGLMRVEPNRPRWEWTTHIVWGQLTTEQILAIQPKDIEVPEQITFQEFCRRTGRKSKMLDKLSRPAVAAVVLDGARPLDLPKDREPLETGEPQEEDPPPEPAYWEEVQPSEDVPF